MTIRVPKISLLVLALLLVGAGFGAAGYYLGRGSIDRKAITGNAYGNGERAGLARGRGQGLREAETTETREIKEAHDNAADAVLGGVEPKKGHYYIVLFKDATGIGLPWVIRESYAVADGTNYSLCADKESICERAGD